MKTTPRSILALAALIALIGAAPARAGVTFYGDRSTFEAATTSLTLIDFNDQVTFPETFTSFGGGALIEGLGFSVASGTLYAVTPDFDLSYDLGDGTVLAWEYGATGNSLTIALPADVTAFGFDFGALNGTFIQVSLASGETYNLPPIQAPTNAPGFAGFISTDAVAYLTITSTDIAPMIDRFVFSPAAVPEPASFISASLASAGLLALVHFRRRRTA